MKNFIKMFFASLLAFIVLSLIPFFIFVGIVASFSPDKDAVAVVPNKAILTINLSSPIVDVISSDPLDYFDINSFKMKKPLELQKAISSIRTAATDERVQAIYIDGRRGVAMSLTTALELRRAIAFFKEQGKKVYSYANSYSTTSYYISSVASEVVLAPLGDVGLFGLSSFVVYYKELLDKLGVTMDLIKEGKYKSAGETFVSDKMSSENREQISAMLNSVWDAIISDISANRSISKDEINRVVNDLSAFTAEGALSNKFIDKIQYYDQFKADLGVEDKNYISLQRYSTTVMSIRSHKEDGRPVLTSPNKIALLNASGTIVNGAGEKGQIGDLSLCAKIIKLRKDSTVKAVVFRINSPGGSASASEYIWRELELLQKVKPLIVSMGTYAASGGYYIAAPADYIFAERTTLTGSIGVFSLIPNFSGAMNKIGLNVYSVSTNENSGLLGGAVYHGLSTAERKLMKDMGNNIYNVFKKRVAEGRNLSVERVEELAQGRVWTGAEAKNNGLIDELGGIVEAVYFAADKAGVANNFILYTQKVEDNPFAMVFEMMGAKVKSLSRPDFGVMQKDFDIISKLAEKRRPVALMPYIIEIQ